MRIDDSNAEYVRSEQLRRVRGDGAEVSAKDTATAAGTPIRTDKVSISAIGKAMAANESAEELDNERLGEIRRRISDGTYDSLEAVDRLARTILDSGDL